MRGSVLAEGSVPGRAFCDEFDKGTCDSFYLGFSVFLCSKLDTMVLDIKL